MKLFLYYTFCSVKNQIKKLCKTWFIIFLLACMVFGGVIGLGLGIVLDGVDDGTSEDGGALPPEEPGVDLENPDGVGTPDDELPNFTKEDLAKIAEVVISVIFIIFMFLAIFGADKDGSAIFTMADVNLLFPSPKKPQSVLLFKLMSQILIGVFISIYFFAQISSLHDAGYSAISIIMMFAAWIMLFAYQKLFNIMIYTLCSTHPRVKKYLRPISLGLVGVICISFFLVYKVSGNPIVACKIMFTSSATDFIPVYGWVKGIVAFAVEGRYAAMSVSLILLIAGAVLLAYAVWHMKADFYEDAMSKSQETEQILEAAKTNGLATRKKERSEKVRERGEFSRGSGASVFFFKELHNRRRFSHFGFLTKTAEFYLVISVAISVIVRFAAHSKSFIPVGLTLAIIAFWRSLGNPLAQDMSKDCFVTIPAGAHEKVLLSLLSGSYACAIDVIPAAAVSAVIIGANPVSVITFCLLIVSVDYYASNVMLFIEFSLPTSLALQVKQSISIMFIYFGLAPIAAVLLVGLLIGLFDAFVLIAAAASIAIGSVFFAFSPLFLSKGRK